MWWYTSVIPAMGLSDLPAWPNWGVPGPSEKMDGPSGTTPEVDLRPPHVHMCMFTDEHTDTVAEQGSTHL